jgi:hypothetical protein
VYASPPATKQTVLNLWLAQSFWVFLAGSWRKMASSRECAHHCEFGCASVFNSGSGFDVIVDLDDRLHGTVGRCTHCRALMIAAASVAMVMGIWVLAVVSSTHDYPVPPTSTFGNVGIEPIRVHR